jgi:ParB/RepB/Spo0J family partition protein
MAIEQYSEQEYILERCIPEPNSGCWLWLGYCSGNGNSYCRAYPTLYYPEQAHRVSYRAFKGPVLKENVVRHLCHILKLKIWCNMTSGNFVSISIGDIIVNRSERQRRELPNIDTLADSINRLQLIHPIVITRDRVLVAGERRLEACRTLGWTHINCQYLDDLEPEIARAIELEENIKRENLPWQDEARAVLEYHELRSAERPDWTQAETALALGLKQPTVAEKIQVARELLAGNEMVAEAPRYSTAKGIVRRAESRKDEEALLALTKRAPSANGGATEETPDSILCADFNEWATGYEGPRFNFIHCDFPYGIGADRFNQGSATSHGGYSDTERDYWTLCSTLAHNLDRLATESCHIMFWFSMHFYADTLKFFAEHTDFRIDPFPLIWTKSDNVGILPDPERGPRRIYETCLFGSRGDRKVVRPTSNSVSSPSQRDEHMSIKPEAMLGQFFRMFVDSNTIMLDPTCGSGGALRAAESLAASHVVGLERDEEFARRANVALNKSRQMRAKIAV